MTGKDRQSCKRYFLCFGDHIICFFRYRIILRVLSMIV
jgi:hypothetical protein